MAAFRRALELGAAFLETDLRLSRDAHFVAIHDAALERTTNGRGQVDRNTLAELRELDVGSWFGPQWARERIPTLEEILAFAREADVVFYLELKAKAAWGVERALVAALRNAQEAARLVVLSFDQAVVETVRRFDPTTMTGLLLDRLRADGIEVAVQIGARQLVPRYDMVTPELVEQAHRADLRVVAWTVNDPREMRRLIAAGVDGIMTDYPDRLCQVLRE